MPSRRLHPDTLLSIQISTIISRNEFIDDPAPVIAELYATAGDRTDLLTAEVGRWIGFYEADHNRTLATALRALDLDMAGAIALGQSRRISPHHTTTGFNGPHGTGLPA